MYQAHPIGKYGLPMIWQSHIIYEKIETSIDEVKTSDDGQTKGAYQVKL